jgi:HSP20 family protein
LRVEDTPQIFARVSPFSLMRRFSEEMDRLFPDVGFGGLASGFGRDFGRLADLEGSMWLPPVEAFVREGKLIVRADLPGLTKDDINVDITYYAGHRRHLSP